MSYTIDTMTTETITIKDTIPIPRWARANWKNRQAVLLVGNDSIIVKRIEPPSWDELIPKLREAGESMTPKMLRDAVRWARRKK